MEIHAPLILDLPPDMARALHAQARMRGRSPIAEARRLLAKGLARDASALPAKTPSRADEGCLPFGPLLAPLRALLAADLSQAQGWDDLQDRLAAHGYTFRERGGGLALYCASTAAHICKASDLGWTYASLMRRFDAPFPGHSHFRLAERVLNRDMPTSDRKRPNPSLFPDSGDRFSEDDDDIVLFEDD